MSPQPAKTQLPSLPNQALEQMVLRLAEHWNMAQIVNPTRCPLPGSDKLSATNLARGERIALWIIDAPETRVSLGRLRECVRALSARSAAPAILILRDREERRIAFPNLTGEEILTRALSPALISNLHRAGLAAKGVTELLLVGLEDLVRKRPLSRAFVRDMRALWKKLNQSWAHVGETKDKEELSLVLLSRLLFLAFVQTRGWLDRRSTFLLEEATCAHLADEEILVALFQPLFLALDTPIHKRSKAFTKLGALPYLNGGLFAQQAVERRHPQRKLPNHILLELLHTLLERYTFCPDEDASLTSSQSIHPAMLGHIFEALMSPEVRQRSGTFYTPLSLVKQLLHSSLIAFAQRTLPTLPERTLTRLFAHNDASELCRPDAQKLLEALASIRVLDPAAGSGAFLLAAHRALLDARITLAKRMGAQPDEHQLRREIATKNLFGVDLLPSAIRICELRLWLAVSLSCPADLSPVEIPPLPNLDLSLRQGDALLEPTATDSLLTLTLSGGADTLRSLIKEMSTLRDTYFHCPPEARAGLQRKMRGHERALYLRRIHQAQALADKKIQAFHALSESKTLFGEQRGLNANERNERQIWRTRRKNLCDLRALVERDEHPFFSWGLHFGDILAEGGFDMVIGNPPWVRPHHLPKHTRVQLRRHYRVARKAAWRSTDAPRARGAQVDLSALFVERALDLAREEGVVAMILPSKLLTSLSGGGLRRLIHSSARVREIIDWSDAPKRLFGATTYPSLLVLERNASPRQAQRLRVSKPGAGQRFTLSQELLPFSRGDGASPWLLTPPERRFLIETLQSAGPPLSKRFPLMRGAFSGANHIFIPQRTHHSPGAPLARITDAQGEEHSIEITQLRKTLRGADLGPFSASPSGRILFPYDANGDLLDALPPLLGRYLSRHVATLSARRGRRPHCAYWSLFRVRPELLGPKVAWRDISTKLEATYLKDLSAIPLNTLYYIPTPRPQEGLLLSAFLNSAIARKCCAALAEPASNGFQRFFAWVVGLLPWPFDRVDPRLAQRIADLSLTLHQAPHTTQDHQHHLDDLVQSAVFSAARRSN